MHSGDSAEKYLQLTSVLFPSVCAGQERNIFNRIFGGFLMRKAYELGWANACSFGSEINNG